MTLDQLMALHLVAAKRSREENPTTADESHARIMAEFEKRKGNLCRAR